MTLPTINRDKLQQICTQIISRKNNLSIDDLSHMVSLFKWSQENNLDLDTIKELILFHKIDLSGNPKEEILPQSLGEQPGRGKKQCPGCKKYVGVRTTICVCGEQLTDSRKTVAKTEIIPKEVVVSDTPGKGKKQCPGCKKYVGIRVKVCLCGEKFADPVPKTIPEPKPAKPIVPEKPVVKYAMPTSVSMNGYFVLTAAGKPPIILKETDFDSVVTWIEQVRNAGLEKDRWYSQTALLNWARHILNSEDSKMVCEHIRDYCSQSQYG